MENLISPLQGKDYSYQNQVDWMVDWLNANDFQNITFFGQDWGGLIGLRIVAREPDRFSKVSMGNTGLPYNPEVSDEVIEEIKAFRESNIKLHPMSMAKQIMQMDSGKLIQVISSVLAEILLGYRRLAYRFSSIDADG